MAQTTDGFLWVESLNALYRFDGVSFERFRPSSGGAFLQDDIGFLLSDGNNGLWTTYRFGGASYIRDGRVINYSEKDGLPPAPRGVIFSMAIDSQQTVWAATIKGLFRLVGSRWYQVGGDWDFPYPAARGVWTDRGGTLWVSAMNKLVFLPRGATKFKDSRVSISASATFTESKDGTIWIADSIEGKLKTLRRSVDDTIVTGPEIHAVLNHALIDRNGCLWIASDADGLFRIPDPREFLRGHPSLHSKSVERYTERQGLTGNSGYWMLEDREGSIWELINFVNRS
jgi:ligand-binding sensor domain-containing protein